MTNFNYTFESDQLNCYRDPHQPYLNAITEGYQMLGDETRILKEHFKIRIVENVTRSLRPDDIGDLLIEKYFV